MIRIDIEHPSFCFIWQSTRIGSFLKTSAFKSEEEEFMQMWKTDTNINKMKHDSLRWEKDEANSWRQTEISLIFISHDYVICNFIHYSRKISDSSWATVNRSDIDRHILNASGNISEEKKIEFFSSRKKIEKALKAPENPKSFPKRKKMRCCS